MTRYIFVELQENKQIHFYVLSSDFDIDFD